jgi:hypothetical protein
MATIKVKKVAVDTDRTNGSYDISGLLSSRYEKLQVSYGVIAPTDYALGDSIVFSDVPSKSIIRATVVAHDPQAPAVLDVYPGSDKNSPFTLKTPTGVTGPVELSYIIEYVRGTGRVGSTTGDNSGEGELFTVVLASSSLAATDAEVQVAKQKVSTITTTQAAALATSTIAAFSTAEVAALPTGDLRALATAQLFALSTTQVAALSTTQVAALTTAQQAALQH